MVDSVTAAGMVTRPRAELMEEIAVTTFFTLRHRYRWMPGAEGAIRARARRLDAGLRGQALFDAVKKIVEGEMIDGLPLHGRKEWLTL